MSRYIDKYKLIENLNYFAPEYYNALINDLITKQPEVDVVEVVHCKDCEYWQDNKGGYPHSECRWSHDETPDEDDYCSYGERLKLS